MNKEIKVNTFDEFQEQIDKKDFKISKIIVNTILKNLNSKKNNIHILSVNCMDSESTFDLSLERKYFVETLQENLQYFVEHELYEKCAEIVKSIEYLNNK